LRLDSRRREGQVLTFDLEIDCEPKRTNLRTPAHEHHDQDNEQDPTDSDSTKWSKSVVTAATAEQQKQD
jgi:hypothetical protein